MTSEWAAPGGSARRVLLVGDGASIHTRRLALAMRAKEWEVHLACFEGEQMAGVSRHLLGKRPPARDERYALAVPRLAALIRRIRPNVVHAHYITSYGVMARAALHFAQPMQRRPWLVMTAWGSDLLVTSRRSARLRPLIAWALRGSDLITGDSADLRERAAQLAPAVEWFDFVFGPDAELLHRQRGVGNAIVSARSLVPSMRVDLVINGFAEARRTGSVSEDNTLIVVGEGDERNSLEMLAPAGVRFIGAISRSALFDLFLESKVLVSVPISDATSAGLLEGIAAGMIPVVNELPANREWVSWQNGEVVPTDPSVADVAAALGRALVRIPDREANRNRLARVVWENQVEGLLSRFGAWPPYRGR